MDHKSAPGFVGEVLRLQSFARVLAAAKWQMGFCTGLGWRLNLLFSFGAGGEEERQGNEVGGRGRGRLFGCWLFSDSTIESVFRG